MCCFVPETQRSEISRHVKHGLGEQCLESGLQTQPLGARSPRSLFPSFPRISQERAHTHLKENADYAANIPHVFYPSVRLKTAEKKFFVTSFSTSEVTGLLACALQPA